MEYLTDFDTDVCCLTETWLKKGDSSKISEIKELGFNIQCKSRTGRGGGVAIVYKKNLKLTRQNSRTYGSFEHIESVVESSNQGLLRICCVYRSGTAGRANISDFCEDFDDYLGHLIHLPGKLIITGDFNIHMEDPQNTDTKRFQSVLFQHNLIQHVSESTHICDGILDLVLTRNNIADNINISNLQVVKTVTSSDHYFVGFTCTFPIEKNHDRVVVSGRCIKNIDLDNFKVDLMNSDLNNPALYIDASNAMEIYDRELAKALDNHAPLKEFKVKPDQDVWMNSECQKARCARRKLERDNRRMKTDESRNAWSCASKHAEAIINSTRDKYYKEQLEASRHDKKKTYSIVEHLMDRNLTKSLRPTNKSDDVVANEMCVFFKNKIEKIYADIENSPLTLNDSDSNEEECRFRGQLLENFKPISEEELIATITELNKKECENDPIPLKLLLKCLDEVKSILLFIVNDSLATGVFPNSLKEALVRPAIKDQNGDCNEYKNYRPISNLTFVSKIIEKTVHNQLCVHLNTHKLHAQNQSGYRSDHSCETATLAVYNDLLCVSDAKNKVILLLLDLSAAFDTVCHERLVWKLKEQFGVAGNVLNWFSSYLSNRSFSVSIGKHKSERCFIRIGVPQGSILGPILFILYTKGLEKIARKHGFWIHLYADDTQLYIEFNPLFHDLTNIESKIIDCLEEIKNWMIQNKLKLNENKTETLIVQTRNNFQSWSVDSISLSNSESIVPSNAVKSLGVLFDEYLTFESHISSVVQSCNIQLRNLRAVASKLDFDLKKQLIHCLVFSKLDYCNALLYGLPGCQQKRLQKVQNSCVRFLFGRRIRKWDSVKPYLKEAHFLPVKQRIDFKIALLTFKCINNIAPDYLKKCIKLKEQPTKLLRNDGDYFLLNVPPIPNYKRTDRSFSYASPNVWNSLPYHLRTCSNISLFKKQLKTFLFEQAFEHV